MFLASAVLCQATALVLEKDGAIVLNFPCKVQAPQFSGQQMPLSPFLAFGRPLCSQGLCSWSGEMAGPAKPPSRRADEPPSARAPGNRTSLVHADSNGRSKRTQRNAMTIRRSVPPLTPPRRPDSARTLGYPQWPQTATQFRRCQRDARLGSERHRHPRDPATRPLRRSPRRPWLSLSPTSPLAACHRVVRRHTCYPVTRRSTRRATQAQATHGGVHKKASHEARNRREECLSSHSPAPPRA